ncbi:MAG: cytidylate kinase family protein [Nanoarchaeota archaeon]|nr:cytidylate kinase family protein [Nanoarchaeota archaeon]
MIITISGDPGSGKSTIAKETAKTLGYNFYSVGDLRGKMAMDRGLTIDQLNDIGKNEAWTDKDADKYQEELGKKEDDFVIEGRLGFHFIPHSTKIFLKVDKDESARRVFKDQREDEEKKETVEEVKEMLAKRSEHDRQRYLKYYNIDHLDLKHYDLVLDTTNLTIDEVKEKLLNFIPSINK